MASGICKKGIISSVGVHFVVVVRCKLSNAWASCSMGGNCLSAVMLYGCDSVLTLLYLHFRIVLSRVHVFANQVWRQHLDNMCKLHVVAQKAKQHRSYHG